MSQINQKDYEQAMRLLDEVYDFLEELYIQHLKDRKEEEQNDTD